MRSNQTPGTTEAKLTKAQRRMLKNEKVRLLREQEAKRKKRNRIILITSSIIAILLIAFVAFKIVTASSEVAAAKNVNSAYGVYVTKDGKASAEPKSGVPIVTIYEDPTCPHCIELHTAMAAAMDKHIAAEDIQFEIRNSGIGPIGQQYIKQSTWGAMSTFYIATHEPEKYRAYHDALMDQTSGLYAAISAAASGKGEVPDVEFLKKTAIAAGVSDNVASDMAAALTRPEWTNYNAKTLEAFRENMKKVGTPAILLNGKEIDSKTYGGHDSAAIAAWLDKVAAGEAE